MGATYRPIGFEEIQIAVEMMRDFYAIDSYPMDEAFATTGFARLVDEPNLGKAWLISVYGKDVGYFVITYIFSFEYKGMIAFIDELFIEESARGMGIGKSTVDFIKSQAKADNVKMLYLEVERHNENAQKLYLARGFKNHHRGLMRYEIT